MINSIEYESRNKVEEINNKTKAIYEKKRAKQLSKLIVEIERDFNCQVKELNTIKAIQESRIRTDIKKQYEQAKSLKLDLLIEQAGILLKTKGITKSLMNSTFKKINLSIAEEKDFVAFCNENDKSLIKKYFNGLIKTMPEIGIGGLILSCKRGKTICDNSYRTRLNILLEKQMKELNKKIFL
ncbi:hypothetical protein NUSPORA_02310 [Nucleospora cyclopteri]